MLVGNFSSVSVNLDVAVESCVTSSTQLSDVRLAVLFDTDGDCEGEAGNSNVALYIGVSVAAVILIALAVVGVQTLKVRLTTPKRQRNKMKAESRARIERASTVDPSEF